MRIKTLLYFVSIAVLYSPVASAQDQPLTIEGTLRYVYHENPVIVSSHYEWEGTRELLPQAQAGWKPRIGAEANMAKEKIEGDLIGRNEDGSFSKSASLSVEQPLFRGFRTVAESDAAEKRIGAGVEKVRQTEQEIFVQAVETYMNVIRDRLLLDLQHQNKDLLAQEKISVQARFDAGDVTQTDVKQTEAQYSKAVADDAIADAQLRASEAAFEKTIGFAPPDIMTMPEIMFAFPTTEDDLIKAAALDNPGLSRSRIEHEAAESDIRTVKSDFYPQVSAYASYIKEYDPQPGIVDDQETSTIGLRARISLYEGGSTLSKVREAKARANQSFVEIRQVEQALRSELISNWKRLTAFDAEISARELEVTASKFSAEGVREEARLGDRTVLDTLDAEQDVLDAQSRLVQARSDRIVVAYRLAAGLGMLVPQRLGFANGQKTATTE